MIIPTRRDIGDDQGSIILALLGIVILTTVASVGLSSVINGQKQSRHDNTYAAALDNASSGLDAMVAAVKNLPAASSQQTLPNTSMYKNVTATPVLNLDSTGNPGSTTWTVAATGESTVQNLTVSRTVEETVTIAHTYRTPVYGAQGLALGPGSSINDYNPGATSNTTDTVTGLLGGLLTTTVPIPNNGTPGAATVGNCTAAVDANGNCLEVAGSDAGSFSQIVADSPPAGPTDTCSVPVANSGSTSINTTGSACGSSTVVASTSPPPTISEPCNGDTTLGINGATLLTLPTNGLLGFTLGVNVLTNNPLSSPLDVCSSINMTVPSLGVLLAGTPVALVGFPITDCTTTVLTGSLESENCTPPATPVLGLYATGGASITLGSACGTGQTGSQCPQTIVDAIVADASGNCQINGDVTLFGAINCNTITYSPGATLTVEYPNTLSTYNQVTHVDYVDNWNEQHH